MYFFDILNIATSLPGNTATRHQRLLIVNVAFNNISGQKVYNPGKGIYIKKVTYTEHLPHSM